MSKKQPRWIDLKRECPALVRALQEADVNPTTELKVAFVKQFRELARVVGQLQKDHVLPSD